ncbi:glycosyltransferase family 4 protein [Formosa maritima]|uniref:Glycosyltransferase family 4 protein n=1 Tax=Formosa maritima TaxID=2592046 RepID=A0A5D0GCP2_9FLAO|nr:glycosyltransferase family 4 protein [Formosa maritima]TYA56664.1 glycosyltransferase family 4 protein [Formosa maritima]
MTYKIGLVLSKPPVYSETFFINKIEGLQEAGYEVVLFVQNNAKSFNLSKTIQAPKVSKRAWLQFFKSLWVFVTLLPYYKRLLLFIRLEKEAKRSHKQTLKNIYNNAHLLKAHVDWLHFGFGTMALQSEHVAKAIGAKMAVSFRGFDIDVYPLKHPGCYELLWTQVDKVHAISNYILKRTYEYGLSEQVVTQIITPAVDIELFKSEKVDSRLTEASFNILTIARLHWIKGLTASLEALALLKQIGIRFKYTIIGEGIEYESLMFAIHQLELQDVVQLLGKQPHESIVNYLSDADVYLQYSLSEGFCNAVLEAQAMGLLCVVSDAEGLQENILHAQTGFVVEKQQPALLAKALENLLHLPSQEKELIRKAAKVRVREVFNLEKQKKAFIEFYE